MGEIRHWTKPAGDTSDLLRAIGEISQPIELLECMSELTEFIGPDPYYRDIDTAIWKAVDRVLGRPVGGK